MTLSDEDQAVLMARPMHEDDDETNAALMAHMMGAKIEYRQRDGGFPTEWRAVRGDITPEQVCAVVKHECPGRYQIRIAPQCKATKNLPES